MHCVSKNDFFGSITIFKNKKSLFLRFTAVWIIHQMDPSPVPFLRRRHQEDTTLLGPDNPHLLSSRWAGGYLFLFKVDYCSLIVGVGDGHR